MSDQTKVRYIGLGGSYESTAYLDRELSDGTRTGTNKHTDIPVHVRWDGTAWREVCFREATWNQRREDFDVAPPDPACSCAE